MAVRAKQLSISTTGGLQGDGTSQLEIKLDSASGLSTGSGGLTAVADSTTGGDVIPVNLTSNGVGLDVSSFDGDGLLADGSGTIDVQADSTTGGDVIPVNVTANGVGLDVSSFDGDGLLADGSGTIDVQADSTTGGDVIPVSVTANGVGLDVSSFDGDGLLADGSGTIDVQADSTTGGDTVPVAVSANGVGLDLTSIDGTGISTTGSGELKIDTASTVTFSGATWTFPAGELLMTGTPDAANEVVHKGYVDSVASGLDLKDSVAAATVEILDNDADISGSPTYSATGGSSGNGQITATLAVSGTLGIDGVTILNGDRILVKDEDSGTAEVHSVDTRADSSGDLNNDYFVIYATPNLAYYVWYNVNSGGSDPSPSAPAGVTYTGVEVAVATDATAEAVATATETELDGLATINGYAPFSTERTTNALTITNYFGGEVTNVAEGVGTNFTFGTDTPGTGMGPGANGIYDVTISGTSLTLDRTTDFDSDSEVTAGAFTFVSEGTNGGNTSWVVISDDDITCGGADGSPIVWAQFSGAGSITAGAGLDKTGDTIYIGDVNKGIQVNADDLEIDASEIAGNGLQENAGTSYLLEVKADSTTGGDVVPVNVVSNGVGLDLTSIDGTGIGTTGSGELTFDATAADGNGLTGSGSVLTVDSDTETGGDIQGVNVTANGVGVDISAIAGTGLSADGSANLQISWTWTQESVTTENITGTDTALSDTLNNTPASAAQVRLYLNGVYQFQGASQDYTISGSTITWRASTGTAVDMDTSDVLVAVYVY